MKKRKNIFIIAIILFIIIVGFLIINSLQTKNQGQLIKINYEKLAEKVENKDSFILVVSQSTCAHCATYKPKVKEVAKNYNIDVYNIDFDYESEKIKNKFLKEFNLTGATPVTLFIENGKEKSIFNRLEGDVSSTKIIDKFEKMGFITK